MASSILITGASGFIGSFIVEEALGRGLEVWAAVRESSGRQYLKDPRINFITLDLGSEEQLRSQLEGKAFDFVVHAAGATKCIHASDFRRTNTLGTINLVNALRKTSPGLKKFVFISSLSVFGPVREEPPHTDISPKDTPRPNTAYGQSKLEAERFLDGLQDFPYIILRPTGVYGPRERDYFLMAKSIKSHVDFAAGFRRQHITFVYVSDVVQAVFLAIEKGQAGKKYFLTDGGVYSSRMFSDLLRCELGNPWLLRVTAPLWLLRLITFCGEYAGRISGKPTALNNDKYHIMSQRNWRCDIGPAVSELGYRPRVSLEEGVRRAVEWYKANGWL